MPNGANLFGSEDNKEKPKANVEADQVANEIIKVNGASENREANPLKRSVTFSLPDSEPSPLLQLQSRSQSQSQLQSPPQPQPQPQPQPPQPQPQPGLQPQPIQPQPQPPVSDTKTKQKPKAEPDPVPKIIVGDQPKVPPAQEDSMSDIKIEDLPIDPAVETVVAIIPAATQTDSTIKQETLQQVMQVFRYSSLLILLLMRR